MKKMFPGHPLPPELPSGKENVARALTEHLPFIPHWDEKKSPTEKGSLPLLEGISLSMEYPDPEKLLETALFDFKRFLKEAGIPEQGKTLLKIEHCSELAGEDFTLTVGEREILLLGGTTEAIRRGIYYLMDRISALEIPFIAPGTETRRFWLKNRISRCFFGPIKRPPFYRDELMDDIDYYPEEYLSHLAREGVNGLWLTVEFHDLCSTTYIKEDPNAQKRLAKLRDTVRRCLRYGIKTWIFCIEPVSWNSRHPLPEGAEELAGPGYGAALTSGVGALNTFCSATEKGRQYLFDATKSIFSQVPGLGGMIVLPMGERVCSCLSTKSSRSSADIPCPKRCSYSVAEIFANLMNPMFRGIRAAAPEADMIVWPYQPDPCQLEDWIFTLPEKLDKEIIFTYNFESGVNKTQLGKIHCGGDYWLSCTGPSDRFGRMARQVKQHCQLGSKLQVACSHEVATVPYIPVPGVLYRKYRSMRENGVAHVMQCWYFGNCPGMMNKAAGLLAMEDFSGTEEEFLEKLAAIDWGSDAGIMAKVWQTFEKAYSFYPLENQFQYYGPMHDGTLWPLHLKQVLRQLPRTWKPDQDPAGDVLGEALKSHTAGECLILLEKMAALWQEGMKEFAPVSARFAHDPARVLDAGVAEAMSILINSSSRIFRFYAMRTALFNGIGSPEKLLEKMEELVRDEIKGSDRLAELSAVDPRLGYHSEAEVAKFFPENLRWRSGLLRDAILPQFEECRKFLSSGGSFAEFARPADLRKCRCGEWYENGALRWKGEIDAEVLRFEVEMKDIPVAQDEYLKFYFLDEEGMKFPVPNTGLARRSSEKIDLTECADLSKEEISGGWRVRGSFPIAMFEGAPRILFGLQLVCYTPDGERNITWPPGEFTNELRLNLSYFTPDRLVLLDLKNH